MSKAIIFSPDAIPAAGQLAAGPGIRYFEMSAGLVRAGIDVTLAVPAQSYQAATADFKIVPWKTAGISELLADHDLAILPQVHGELSRTFPEVAPANLPTAVDLYDPVLIENLALQPADDDGVRSFAGYLADIIPILKRGDFFFCANQRQYYYYLGILNVLGRINPMTFRDPPLKLVPFGVSADPPRHYKKVMRGRLVGENDLVILWFSGIYPWFDARTLINAMPAVVSALPNAKLVVMGGVHPRGHAPDHEYRATVAAAEKLGLIDKSVFFVDWRPYDERVNWYLESDVAVVTHKQALETEISHRTRVIDLIWAGLPVVVSSGDEVGATIKAAGCGDTVKVGDARDLADKLIDIAQDGKRRKKMSAAARRLAATLTWDKVLEPLVDWAQDPTIAKDRQNDAARQSVLRVVGTFDDYEPIMEASNSSKVSKIKEVYRDDGLAAVVRRSISAVWRRLKGD